LKELAKEAIIACNTAEMIIAISAPLLQQWASSCKLGFNSGLQVASYNVTGIPNPSVDPKMKIRR
jgi:hypothetical protein